MTDPIRVEIVQCAIPAGDPDVGAADAPRQVWEALIGGVRVPLVSYALDQADDGGPVLALVFRPDSLQVGDPAVATVQPVPAGELARASSWGDPTSPDPRTNIPGWEPATLGAQAAGHTVRNMGSHVGDGSVRLRPGWNESGVQS